MKLDILKEIGRRLMDEVGSLGPEERRRLIGTGAAGDSTYVIDERAERVIIDTLSASGEPLTLISEEAGEVEINGGGGAPGGGGLRVVADPVDGSKNAVSGIPFYCTSLAVARGNEMGDVFLAYIINLVNGDEFWAERGKGAFMNGEKIQAQGDDVLYLTAYEAQSPSRDIERTLPLLRESRKTRCLGSIALDLAYLAAGAVSIFANPSRSRSFDFAGGALLVREAGGVITDFKGRSIDGAELGLKRTASLLASGNGALHEKALGLLGSSRRGAAAPLRGVE